MAACCVARMHNTIGGLHAISRSVLNLQSLTNVGIGLCKGGLASSCQPFSNYKLTFLARACVGTLGQLWRDVEPVGLSKVLRLAE